MIWLCQWIKYYIMWVGTTQYYDAVCIIKLFCLSIVRRSTKYVRVLLINVKLNQIIYFIYVYGLRRLYNLIQYYIVTNIHRSRYLPTERDREFAVKVQWAVAYASTWHRRHTNYLSLYIYYYYYTCAGHVVRLKNITYA